VEVIGIAPAHTESHFIQMLFISDVINYSLSNSAPGSPSVHHSARYYTNSGNNDCLYYSDCFK